VTDIGVPVTFDGVVGLGELDELPQAKSAAAKTAKNGTAFQFVMSFVPVEAAR
jgi:hypothetical protein